MSQKPLILISLDYSEENTYSNLPWYALRADYSNAVELAGGIPLFIPYSFKLADEYLDIADGVIVPGGDVDIPPSYYSDDLSVSKHAILNHTRTKFDFYFIEKALEKQIPFLGICAGQQVLNTLCGGDMIQHIPDEIENALDHKPKVRNQPAHPIKIERNSILFDIIGQEEIMVNSNHHQAVKNLGRNFICSAKSSDGVIEAIEHKSHPFCLGVEWHPEYMETIHNRKIFEYFIKQALIYKSKKLK